MTQQFALIAALQAIIHDSHLRDNFQRSVKIFNVDLLLVFQLFKTQTYPGAPVLPVLPLSIPQRIRDFSRCIQAHHPHFFVIHRLQRCGKQFTLVGVQMTKRLRNIVRICSADCREQIRIDLNVHQRRWNLTVDAAAQKVDAAAGDTVVRRTAAAARSIRR